MIQLKELTLKADTVVAGENSITVDGKEITIYAEADASKLPWGEIRR